MSLSAMRSFCLAVGLVVALFSSPPTLGASPEYISAIFGRYGVAQQDGHWFGYFGLVPTDPSMDPGRTAGFFKQRYPDLYRIDIGTGEVHRVTTGNSESRSWAIDNTGQIVAD
jgi:hypothetical protein